MVSFPASLEECGQAGVICTAMDGPYRPMRPRARRLAQHGGPPGWLAESDPTGVILYVTDGPYRLSFCAVPVALTGAAQLRAEGIPSCCHIKNVHNHPLWATSRKEGMACYSSRSMPSLWYRLPWRTVPPALTDRITLALKDRTAYPGQGLLSCELLPSRAAAAIGTTDPDTWNHTLKTSRPKPSHWSGKFVLYKMR